MRWLLIIIVSIISCVAGEHNTSTTQHSNKSTLSTQLKNQPTYDYQLVPLSRSFFCHPPGVGMEMMKVKTTTLRPNYKEKIKDPIIIAGIVLFLFIGSIFLFPAYYLFRIAAGCTGFITSIYFACQLHGFFNANTIYFSISLIRIGIPVGMAAIIVFGYFYTFAMYTLTFISGWLVVVFWSTFALATDDIFKHLFIRDAVSLSFALLFVIFGRFYENIAICVCLPFLGAYLIGLGIDLVYQTGLVYTLGTSICLYEPLPKYTNHTTLTVCIVAIFWLLGIGAYIMVARGKIWGLNIQRIYTEEE
ncbi:hypothetical protein K501DRAFT_276704 [Backusella circina FSU 941]|nr:hypothetical protein K501DRAFT_276704 [Backusella circina FSU 941]